ncbi:hypothetical protein A9Q89_11665 [Gammaproteobacteria bacterium 53_120_T64]|nr:hypothetical protein A9Q89_11665 [Gammaproteobacteria bacterium 53_120_T64]
MRKAINPRSHLNFTPAELNSAYHWLCQQRKHHPASADIGSFRCNGGKYQLPLLEVINQGHYRFSPLKRLRKANGQSIHLWCSEDALVMKLLAGRLARQFKLPKSCTHIKGHGGLKKAVCRVQQQLKHYQFVCKTDVKQFYEAIDHALLSEQIDQHISCRTTRYYLQQVIRRTVEYGGNYRDITQGIARGCPLAQPVSREAVKSKR